MVGKKLIIFMVFAFFGLNLYAQESGWTFKPFFGGGGFSGVIGGTGNYGLGGVVEFAFLFFDNSLQMGGHIIVSINICTRGYIR